MTDILSHVSDVATQKAAELEVDILPTGKVHSLLQAWKVLPKKRLFTINPVTYGNLIRISKLLLSIDMSVFDMKNPLESNYHAIAGNAETIAKVVAIAIHNNRSEPPASLVQFILFNFTSNEMVGTLGIVLKQMNVAGFMTSIISVRGLNVLESGIASVKNANESEMSPMDQREIIAPGT
jgi:hypothetical protein